MFSVPAPRRWSFSKAQSPVQSRAVFLPLGLCKAVTVGDKQMKIGPSTPSLTSVRLPSFNTLFTAAAGVLQVKRTIIKTQE